MAYSNVIYTLSLILFASSLVHGERQPDYGVTCDPKLAAPSIADCTKAINSFQLSNKNVVFNPWDPIHIRTEGDCTVVIRSMGPTVVAGTLFKSMMESVFNTCVSTPTAIRNGGTAKAGGVEVEIRERVIPFPPRLPAHGKSIQTSKVITNFVHPTPVHPALVPSSTSSFSFAQDGLYKP